MLKDLRACNANTCNKYEASVQCMHCSVSVIGVSSYGPHLFCFWDGLGLLVSTYEMCKTEKCL